MSSLKDLLLCNSKLKVMFSHVSYLVTLNLFKINNNGYKIKLPIQNKLDGRAENIHMQ